MATAMPAEVTAKQARIAWLEQDYDQPAAFALPPFAGVHTPLGLFSTKPNHRSDCRCETGGSEIWLQADAAAKWRAS